MKQVCNPLSATCSVEVNKKVGTSNQYDILVKSVRRIYPNSMHKK